MRLENVCITVGASDYDKKAWLSIFKPHDYVPMLRCDFCEICKHSLEFHKENKWANKRKKK
jgi:hypothetical protein